MKKIERQVEVLISCLAECKEVEQIIDTLPRGYISVKQISGHTYYYRQWREDNKIVSSYVNEQHINIVKQKIEIRKAYEKLLTILAKDLKKMEKAVLKAGYLNESQIQELKNGKSYDEVVESK